MTERMARDIYLRARRVRSDADVLTLTLLTTFFNKLDHRSTNTGLGSTTSAPRGGDIKDKEREVRAGRSQGSRPSVGMREPKKRQGSVLKCRASSRTR